jgi:ABC-2 type transport system ATP-binding protein
LGTLVTKYGTGETAMATELAIRTEDLTKQFDRHVAVNSVDIAIAAGEVYGLIGPNGAGKTTLMRMLATAEEPTLGEIYINGERLLRDRSNTNLKRLLGYLPDDFPLYDDLTVWDYLDYFARLYKLSAERRQRRLYDVLELVQLSTKRNSKIATLSRGMKQRLSLARTIIHEPILLLLDEPVSGLDPIARMQFRQIIKTLQEAGMTILISSHVLSDLAELCTSVGIMELGFLVESCRLTDLYQRLSRQQILISTLGDLAVLKRELNSNSLVSDMELLVDTNQIRVDFSGTEADAADLLRLIVHAQIPITNFQCSQEDLETIVLKMGHQQAS